MLPSILDIATNNAIILDSRSLKKTEVRAKCPFCLEDSNNGKHYLSLNVVDNVYKCWNCKARGGVLDFESQITGQDYEDVKAKYYEGRAKKKPSLNTRQLETIGIEKDSSSMDEQEIFNRWMQYESSQLCKWFAEYVVINYLSQERALPLFQTLQVNCKKSPIRNAYGRIATEFLKEDQHKSDWAREGLFLARTSWQMATDNGHFENVVTNISFLHYLAEKRKTNSGHQSYVS